MDLSEYREKIKTRIRLKREEIEVFVEIMDYGKAHWLDGQVHALEIVLMDLHNE